MAIGNVIVLPFSSHALQSMLAFMLVRVVPSTQTKNNCTREKEFYEKYGDDN